jgi:segregation and condensation protein B
MKDLENIIEALLFAAGEPLSHSQLARITKTKESEVISALGTLQDRLTNGITLVQSGTSASLTVSAGFESYVNELLGDPETREIGQAGLEVLSILLYQGPSARSTIDYIRGVNSSSSIRTLLMRGLIERTKGNNAREIIYQPTTDALEHLGVTNADALPKSEDLRASLKEFLNNNKLSEEKEV